MPQTCTFSVAAWMRAAVSLFSATLLAYCGWAQNSCLTVTWPTVAFGGLNFRHVIPELQTDILSHKHGHHTHVTPLLWQLLRLPVWHQKLITFKIVGLVYQSLPYFTYDCRQLLDVIHRPLCSGSNGFRMLSVPCTHKWFRDRSFMAAVPRLRNDLPPGLQRPDLTFPVFKQKQKTHLFGLVCRWDRGTWWLFCIPNTL